MSNAKTAVVTGGTRGLGRDIVRLLVARGWNVVFDGRDRARVQEAAQELAVSAAQIRALTGDVADASHRTALARAAAEFGRVDAVINNASTLGASPLPRLLDFPLDTLRRVYEVNVYAPLALVQALWPNLRRGAAVVNVSSDAGVEPYAGWGGYGSSKAALEQLSAILRVENPQFRVYTVDPGDMRTDMHQAAFPGEDISDRPLPLASAQGILALLESDLPAGRYHARRIAAQTQDEVDHAPAL